MWKNFEFYSQIKRVKSFFRVIITNVVVFRTNSSVNESKSDVIEKSKIPLTNPAKPENIIVESPSTSLRLPTLVDYHSD